MFGFIKKMFIGLLSVCTIGSFGVLLVFNSKGTLKFLALNSQPRQLRPTLININSNEALFYPFFVSANKSAGSCNTVDDPYGRIFVPNKIKNMNVKVFNLMWGVNETRFLGQHESRECKCRLNKSECNSKQKWNHNECRCECKELDDWGSCKNDYMWNPSTCVC